MNTYILQNKMYQYDASYLVENRKENGKKTTDKPRFEFYTINISKGKFGPTNFIEIDMVIISKRFGQLST